MLAEVQDKTSRRSSSDAIEAGNQIPYYLSVVNNTLSWGASYIYLRLFGVGLNEWRVLAALVSEPGVRASVIADQVVLNKSVVSRSVKVLEDAGFLRIDLGKGKRDLYVTPKGKALYDKILRVSQQREEALMEGFSEDEKLELCTLLSRMQENLPKVEAADKQLLRRRR